MNRIRVAIDVLTTGARKSLAEFRKQIADADTASGKLRAGWAGLGDLVKQNALAIAAAGAAVAGAAFKMAQGAAETEAAFASLNQIAGETIANDVAGWADDAVESFGLSNRALFTYSKSLANVGASVGQTEAEMRSFIETHLKMAADLAAFADTSPDQVMQDLMAAYAGSSEVLQKYGVFANETNLKNLLLAETGQKITGTLTSQQRVLALTLALKQKHADIDGQWSRESDELAGQQARLAATWTNISDAIGKAVLPAFVDLFDAINKNSDAIETMAVSVGEAVEDIGEAAQALGALKTAYEDLPGPIKWAADRMHDMRGPLGSVRWGAENLASSLSDLQGRTRSMSEYFGDFERAARGRAAPGLKVLRDETEDAARATRIAEDRARLYQRTLEGQTRRQRDAADAASEHAEALDDLASIQRGLIGGEIGVRDAQRQATEALREYEEAAANGARSAEKLLRLQQSVVDAERGRDSAEDAVIQAKRAEDEAERRLQNARRKENNDEEVARLEDDARKARDKVYSAEDRARNADRAIDEARRRVAEEERKASPEELAELRDRATLAQLRAAEAAAQYEADLKRANGETVTAADETRILRDELGNLATAFAPGSPLRQNITGWIGDLETAITRMDEAATAAQDERLRFFEAQRDEMSNRFGGFARGRGASVSTSTTNITYVAPPSGPQFVKADMRDYERRNGSDR